MRNTKKKQLNLKKFTVASAEELELIKGRSATFSVSYSGQTYPPSHPKICIQSNAVCEP
ncbi:MAG: hypothetical protein AAF611_13060 [Bacteroidota bacterium]